MSTPVRKGPRTITDHDHPKTDELFSHPVAHRSPHASGPDSGQRPAYDNLFREPDLPPVPDNEHPVRSHRVDPADKRRPGNRN